MKELLEKLMEQDFEDVFKPTSDEEIQKRFDTMSEDERKNFLMEELYQLDLQKLCYLTEEAGGDPISFCVDKIIENLEDDKDVRDLYLRVIKDEI